MRYALVLRYISHLSHDISRAGPSRWADGLSGSATGTTHRGFCEAVRQLLSVTCDACSALSYDLQAIQLRTQAWQQALTWPHGHLSWEDKGKTMENPSVATGRLSLGRWVGHGKSSMGIQMDLDLGRSANWAGFSAFSEFARFAQGGCLAKLRNVQRFVRWPNTPSWPQDDLNKAQNGLYFFLYQ